MTTKTETPGWEEPEFWKSVRPPTPPPDFYDVGAHDVSFFDSAPTEPGQPKKEGDE